MARPTAKDKRHFKEVADLGCIIHGTPAEIHHSRDGLGMGQRDHTKVYPLCPMCHRLGPGNRHDHPKEFAELYGTDSELVAMVSEMLEGSKPIMRVDHGL